MTYAFIFFFLNNILLKYILLLGKGFAEKYLPFVKYSENHYTANYGSFNVLFLGDVLESIRVIFDVPFDVEIRLFCKYMSNSYHYLSKMESTLQEAAVYSGQVFSHIRFRVRALISLFCNLDVFKNL